MSKKDQQRQGDILFQEIDELPVGVKPSKGETLAHGEVTGHSHRVADMEGVEKFEDEAGNIYLRRMEMPISVIHGNPENLADSDHASLELKPGKWYRVERQREYDPIAVGRERQVID